MQERTSQDIYPCKVIVFIVYSLWFIYDTTNHWIQEEFLTSSYDYFKFPKNGQTHNYDYTSAAHIHSGGPHILNLGFPLKSLNSRKFDVLNMYVPSKQMNLVGIIEKTTYTYVWSL